MSEPKRKLSMSVPWLPQSMEADKKASDTCEPEGKNYTAWDKARAEALAQATQKRWAGSE